MGLRTSWVVSFPKPGIGGNKSKRYVFRHYGSCVALRCTHHAPNPHVPTVPYRYSERFVARQGDAPRYI